MENQNSVNHYGLQTAQENVDIRSIRNNGLAMHNIIELWVPNMKAKGKSLAGKMETGHLNRLNKWQLLPLFGEHGLHLEHIEVIQNFNNSMSPYSYSR